MIELYDSSATRLGWQYTATDNTVERYDADGRLLASVPRNGNVLYLGYSTENTISEAAPSPGLLTHASDAFGNKMTFSYNSQGQMVQITLPDAGEEGLSPPSYHYGYDALGNLISVIFPNGRVRTYHYNEPDYIRFAELPHALTGITDENGERYATYSYDSLNRVTATEHAGGADRHVFYYPNQDGRYTRVTDPLGSRYNYQFQNFRGIARSLGQSQPAGSGCRAASSVVTHDANGNTTSRTDFNGNKTCYAYDTDRNLEIARVKGLAATSNCPADLENYTPAVGTDQRKILTEWHDSLRLPLRRLEANRETTTRYDTYGNITLQTVRDLTTNETRTWNTRYIYHESIPGIILQKIINGPRKDVLDITATDYYSPEAGCQGGHNGCRGHVSQITNALGHTTHFNRYNASGQPEEIIDPNGLKTFLSYDLRQRLRSRTIGNETTLFDYDGTGQLIRITNPR